jgi:hypothetical protein
LEQVVGFRIPSLLRLGSSPVILATVEARKNTMNDFGPKVS